MTMMTISDQDPRSIKAVEIAAGAGQWLKCRTSDGWKAYGIPSQCLPGRYYLVDVERCTCADFTRRQVACKHIMAVRLHVALVKGSRQPRRAAFQPHVNGSGETIHMPACLVVAPPADADAAFWRRFED
jgi:hypothetical protein